MAEDTRLPEESTGDWQQTLQKSEDRVQLLQDRLRAVEDQLADVTADRDKYQHMYEEVITSFSWKMMKPFRAVTGFFKKVLRECPLTRRLFKGLSVTRRLGWRVAWGRLKAGQHQKQQFVKKLGDPSIVSAKELAFEKDYRFDRDIKISVIVPLYNTPIRFLKEMIESVKAQTYGNWELCLADGSDDEHTEVGTLTAAQPLWRASPPPSDRRCWRRPRRTAASSIRS